MKTVGSVPLDFTLVNDMKDLKKTYELRFEYDLDSVLDSIDCKKDNPNYESYKGQLIELVEKHRDEMTPVGYKLIGERYGNKVVECLVTLNAPIDGFIASYFAEHFYLEGMMMNALADLVLFNATNQLYDILTDEVSKNSQYLSVRKEPGNTDVDMIVQKAIFDAVVPEFNLEMTITEGYMLSPTKSLVYYYELTDEDCSFGLDHDCSSCDSMTCGHRKHVIRIHKDNTTEVLQAKTGENLLDVLRKHKVFVDAPCNGMGTCGKCKVNANSHGYELAEKELKVLSEEEVSEGQILACYHVVDRNLEIHMESDAAEQEIETGYEAFEVKDARYDADAYMKEHYPIGIGVDIGTTTLAVSLINLVTHEVIDMKKRINPQKAFGADVISRIMYVGSNSDSKLSALIRETIEEMALELIKDNGYNSHHIEEMVISGNTTMVYLLLDIDPAALAVSPFTTIDMAMKVCDSKELFNKVDSFKVTILPWVSAYVGGDIISGLYANHMIDKEANIVFVDIGTNGEMVLRTKDRMISAATAAGPAFEGANIRCGMGSISGAICEIHADGDGYDVETLGDAEPAGICGSALIDAVALLHKQGLVDDMGFMEKPVMFYDDIGIYPEDIRQVQLAKAAIMAGVDVLLKEADLSYDDIDAFYIAGGFGSHIDIDNSAYIGLIPKEVTDRVKVVGNSSLAGSVRYLLEQNGADEIEAIRQKCEYVELSTSMEFNNAYVMGMTFGEPLSF